MDLRSESVALLLPPLLAGKTGEEQIRSFPYQPNWKYVTKRCPSWMNLVDSCCGLSSNYNSAYFCCYINIYFLNRLSFLPGIYVGTVKGKTRFLRGLKSILRSPLDSDSSVLLLTLSCRIYYQRIETNFALVAKGMLTI